MNLIYDRTQSDVDNAIATRSKYQALGDWSGITEDEIAQLKRGTYSCFDDMNRVDAAVRELGGMLTAAGYPVEYADPKQPEPEPEDEDIILTSADFQAGAYLYTTGVFRAGYAGYVCTKARISVQSGKCICVRTNLTLLQYSGFVWYDANKNFIANTFPSSSQGEAPIQWNGNFQAIPPENAVYCDIDINSSNITPATVGTVYVRQELSPETAPLPNDYRRVEYIESDGTQYIDTGYKANQDTRVVFDAYILQTTTTATGLFGCRQAMGSNGFYIYEQNSDLGEYNDGYGSLYTRDIPLSASARHIIDKNKNKTYIDETIAHTYAAQTFTVPVTLTLFAIHQSNGVDERMSVCRLYSCVIYDNGTIVRYYIPCTNASGIAGLYDTVSGVFYTNAGTGSFAAGADVAPKPETDEWVVGDIINYDTWGIYLKNVQNIREAYYTMPDTPELPMLTAPLKFDGANAIEKLLYDVSQLYDAMVASYRPCGSFKCGSNAQHLPLQRSVI